MGRIAWGNSCHVYIRAGWSWRFSSEKLCWPFLASQECRWFWQNYYVSFIGDDKFFRLKYSDLFRVASSQTWNVNAYNVCPRGSLNEKNGKIDVYWRTIKPSIISHGAFGSERKGERWKITPGKRLRDKRVVDAASQIRSSPCRATKFSRFQFRAERLLTILMERVC